MKKNLVNVQTQDSSDEYFVEEILDKCLINGKIQYFLKWKDYSEEHNTWEPIENLHCKDLIKQFEDNLKQKEREKLKEKEHLKQNEKKKVNLKQTENDNLKPKDKENKDEQNHLLRLTRGNKRNISNNSSVADLSNKRKKITSSIKPMIKKVNDYKNKINDQYNQSIKIPEKIIGATDAKGELMFLMQWKNINEAEFILAKEANILCPQIVINFYEERLVFNH